MKLPNNLILIDINENVYFREGIILKPRSVECAETLCIQYCYSAISRPRRAHGKLRAQTWTCGWNRSRNRKE